MYESQYGISNLKRKFPPPYMPDPIIPDDNSNIPPGCIHKDHYFTVEIPPGYYGRISWNIDSNWEQMIVIYSGQTKCTFLEGGNYSRDPHSAHIITNKSNSIMFYHIVGYHKEGPEDVTKPWLQSEMKHHFEIGENGEFNFLFLTFMEKHEAVERVRVGFEITKL